MKIEFSGVNIYASDFWDCDCQYDYIHRKATYPTCPRCGANHEDSPDARVTEILIHYPDSINKGERYTAVCALLKASPTVFAEEIKRMDEIIAEQDFPL